jgi:hypothetical protein
MNSRATFLKPFNPRPMNVQHLRSGGSVVSNQLFPGSPRHQCDTKVIQVFMHLMGDAIQAERQGGPEQSK